MSAVKIAAEALQTAAKGVAGVRVHTDLGAAVDPPATIVGPPALTWEGACVEPTEAQFPVWVVEAADERAMERLWERVPLVSEALDGAEDATVRRADPGTYPTGGVELPAYVITVDVALGGM